MAYSFSPEQVTLFREVFRLCDVDGNGVLDKEELTAAFKNLGYNETSLRSILHTADKNNDGVVDFEEFLSALSQVRASHGFSPSQLTVFKETFDSCDIDGNGVLDQQELASAFERLGYRPSSMINVFQKADKNGDGVIEFDEFLSALWQVKANTHGFTPNQVADFRSIFNTCDINHDGRLDKREAVRAFQNSGFDSSSLQRALQQADKNNDGVIDFDEFLAALWKSKAGQGRGQGQGQGHFTPQQVAALKRAFDSCDTNRNGILDKNEAIMAFEGLGYPRSTLKRVLQRADINRDGKIDFNEFLAALAQDHSKGGPGSHGFASHQVAAFKRAFNSCDINRNGTLDHDEAVVAFRNLGYSPQSIRRVLRRADKNGDGKIDFDEFLTVLSQEGSTRGKSGSGRYGLSSHELAAFRRAFNSCDINGDGTLNKDEAVVAFENLGFDPQHVRGVLRRADRNGDGKIDFNEFVAALSQDKKGGEKFSSHEIAAFRRAFNSCDINGDGTLDHDEAIVAFENLGFNHQSIRSVLQRADKNGDGKIQFNEFLSALSDHHGRRKRHNFSSHQVAAFRRAFNSCDLNGDGTLDHDEAVVAFENLGWSPQSIRNVIRKADKNGDGRIDFQEFLAALHQDKQAGQKFSPHEVAAFRRAFRSCDLNGDGTLDHDEAVVAFENLGYSPQIVRGVLRRADRNGDGRIDFQEFLSALSGSSKNHRRHRFSSQQVAAFRRAFNSCDINGDGTLDHDEAVVAFENLGWSPQSIRNVLRKADRNGDGRIDFQEFLVALHQDKQPGQKFSPHEVAAFRRAFKSCDLNGDGTLDHDEAVVAFENLGYSPQIVRSVLRRADRNGDGRIDFNEFVSALSKTNKNRRHRFSPHEVAAFRRAFNSCDINGDGTLDHNEAVVAFENLGFSPQSVRSVLQRADKNGDGRIDFQEFLSALSQDRVPGQKFSPHEIAAFKRAFRSCDLNDNGVLDHDEAVVAFENLGFPAQSIRRVLQKADKNGDGKIDFQEFLGALSSHSHHRKSRHFSPQQVAAFRRAFNSCDINGDGSLDHDEAVNAFKNLGFAPHSIRRVLQKADKNKDGKIDFHEFLRVLARDHSNISPGSFGFASHQVAAFRRAFNSCDINGDGTLDHDEAVAAFSNLGFNRRDIRRVLRKADKNKDGKISFQEFLAALAGTGCRPTRNGRGSAFIKRGRGFLNRICGNGRRRNFRSMVIIIRPFSGRGFMSQL